MNADLFRMKWLSSKVIISHRYSRNSVLILNRDTISVLRSTVGTVSMCSGSKGHSSESLRLGVR